MTNRLFLTCLPLTGKTTNNYLRMTLPLLTYISETKTDALQRCYYSIAKLPVHIGHIALSQARTAPCGEVYLKPQDLLVGKENLGGHSVFPSIGATLWAALILILCYGDCRGIYRAQPL